MSKAVFLVTLYRFTNLWTLICLFLFIVGIPILLVTGVAKLLAFTANDWIVEVILSLITASFTAPFFPLLVACMFVRNSIGNAKSLNDGEYLALLFSRPLARSSYVFAKWLAGSFAVFAIIICQLLCLSLGLHFIKLTSQLSIEYTDIANILFNSLGATALVIMVQSFPPRVGRVLYLTILYGTVLIPLLFSSPAPDNAVNKDYQFQTAVSTVCTIFRSFLYPAIDMHSYLDSVKFDWLPLLTFVSNITLYLFVAVLVITRREFFYANE